MVRDQETGKSKGFCFLKYDDQQSTVLAVDNMNGANLLGRTLRVDHSREYKQKTKRKKKKNYRNEESEESEQSEVELDEEGKPRVKGFNVAPKGWLDPVGEESSESEQEDIGDGIDLDDPMRDYLIEKRKEEKLAVKEHKSGKKRIKEEDGEEQKHKHRHRSSHRSEKEGEEPSRHRHRHDRHHLRIEDENGKRDPISSDNQPQHPDRGISSERRQHRDGEDTRDRLS